MVFNLSTLECRRVIPIVSIKMQTREMTELDSTKIRSILTWDKQSRSFIRATLALEDINIPLICDHSTEYNLCFAWDSYTTIAPLLKFDLFLSLVRRWAQKKKNAKSRTEKGERRGFSRSLMLVVAVLLKSGALYNSGPVKLLIFDGFRYVLNWFACSGRLMVYCWTTSDRF
jgi:hypothetical protein